MKQVTLANDKWQKIGAFLTERATSLTLTFKNDRLASFEHEGVTYLPAQPEQLGDCQRPEGEL